MRIFLFLFILSITLGCATRNIKYDRNKILKKYSADYKMFIDNEKMDLETVFLNKDNIENIRINKHTRELKITQFKTTKLFEINNLNLDSLGVGQRGWTMNNIELIVIDGIPLTDSSKKNTKIDLKGIKSISVLIMDRMNNTSSDGNVLLITMK
ncbi:hypothetical protein [Winogradskyella wichelsiae]|uniref:hypothetical protein n=1 Tax=Winogradskyella wichelsiae TaxID=2697007 RepID=UPI0015CDC116|nr:hypothetical protein [Winogradskyella wichelsiae]